MDFIEGATEVSNEKVSEELSTDIADNKPQFPNYTPDGYIRKRTVSPARFASFIV